MKVQLFKNLIKEAVREVLKEELKEIINEIKPLNSASLPTSNGIPSKLGTESVMSSNGAGTYSTIQDMLNETRRSMTNQDFKNVVGDGGISAPDLGMSSFQDSFNSSEVSEAGLDLSSLGFVKNAAAIYNLANEKSIR